MMIPRFAASYDGSGPAHRFLAQGFSKLERAHDKYEAKDRESRPYKQDKHIDAGDRKGEYHDACDD